jgi:hypothetical protein
MTDDGAREGTYQDWEIDATFSKWCRLYGPDETIAKMIQVFGADYPSKGMLLAMGTHSLYPETWLINGVIRLDDSSQFSMF